MFRKKKEYTLEEYQKNLRKSIKYKRKIMLKYIEKEIYKNGEYKIQIPVAQKYFDRERLERYLNIKFSFLKINVAYEYYSETIRIEVENRIKNEELKKEKADLQEKYEKQVEEYRELHSKVLHLENKIREKESKITKLENNIVKLNCEIERKDININNLQKEYNYLINTFDFITRDLEIDFKQQGENCYQMVCEYKNRLINKEYDGFSFEKETIKHIINNYPQIIVDIEKLKVAIIENNEEQ